MNKQSSLRTVLNSVSSQLTIAAAVLAIASQGFAQSYTLIELGTLNGGFWSRATGINEAGQIVGFSRTAEYPGVDSTFLWENGVMISIGPLGNDNNDTWGNGINELGVIGGYGEDQDFHDRAFRWQNGRMTELPTLGSMTRAYGINDLGDIAGWSTPENFEPRHAAMWIGEKIFDLGILDPQHNTYGVDINNSRQVVGWGYVGGPSPLTAVRGFLWSNEVMYVLPGLVGDDSSAEAINDAGCIAGKARGANGAMHPVIWLSKESPIIPIIDLGLMEEFAFGFANAVNNVGQVVGEYWAANCGWDEICAHPFIWENGESKLLDDLIPPDTGWDLDFSAAINDLGQIVGEGVAPNGQRQAFLLNPIIPGDLNGDLVVNTSDLLILFSNWGPCVNCNDCPADLDDDCEVGTNDLLELFSNWS